MEDHHGLCGHIYRLGFYLPRYFMGYQRHPTYIDVGNALHCGRHYPVWMGVFGRKKRSPIIIRLLKTLFANPYAFLWQWRGRLVRTICSSGLPPSSSPLSRFLFILLDKPKWPLYFSNKLIISRLLSGFAGVMLLVAFGSDIFSYPIL
jgi:hypothetical protein